VPLVCNATRLAGVALLKSPRIRLPVPVKVRFPESDSDVNVPAAGVVAPKVPLNALAPVNVFAPETVCAVFSVTRGKPPAVVPSWTTAVSLVVSTVNSPSAPV
jgi:hypothetical protein